MTPKEVDSKMKAYYAHMKATVSEEIRTLVKAHGGAVSVPTDHYMCHPTIYGADCHVSILAFKGARISPRGNVVLLSETKLKSPHLDNLPMEELLQVWDMLIHACET